MNKWFVCFFLLSAAGASSWAASSTKKVSTPEMSVRDEAILENESIDQKAYKKTIRASEAQQANVSSFLKLKDPTPELQQRSWLWDMGFKLQTLKPSGYARVEDLGVNLDSYGSGLMPSLDLGILVPMTPQAATQWSTGPGVSAGYMTQKTTLVSPSGYQFSDTRLSTSLLSLVWKNQFRDTSHPRWSYLVNPAFGEISYSQGNPQSSLANFTQHSGFFGLGLGVDYSVSRQWGLLAEYDYRDISGAAQGLQIQKDNFEIGTTVTW